MTPSALSSLRVLRIFLLGLVVLSIGTTLMVRALPGDPVELLFAESSVTLDRATIEAELGLNQSALDAIPETWKNYLRGDWGKSLLSREPLGPLLLQRLARSALLGALALSFALILSLSLALSAAPAPGRTADRVVSLWGALSASMPLPVVALVLVLLLSLQIPIFRVSRDPILPAFSLSFAVGGFWARLLRDRIRQRLHHPSAVSARARGVSEPWVLLKYSLAPQSGALLAYLGTQFGFLLGGSFVVETLFDWPGLGQMVVESIRARDYPATQAAVLWTGTLSLLGTCLGSWAQSRTHAKSGDSRS